VLALNQVAVQVALAEAGEGNVVVLSPGDETAELDLVIAHGLRGEGRFLVEEELAQRFVPGHARRDGVGTGWGG